MRRRTFIALFGPATATAALLIAGATPTSAQGRPHISILHSGFPNRSPVQYLFAELRALGYEDGRTAEIELLGAEGNEERLRMLVEHLGAEKPTVIIAITSPAVLAIKRAGLVTPVVFQSVADPVGLGIVESLAHPGGNFTGVAYSEAELGGKRLELLVDAIPSAKRVAVIWSASLLENAAMLDDIRRSASRLAIEVYPRELAGVDDLAPAFDDAVRAGAQGLVFMTDNALFGRRKQVAELALAHHLPSIHSFPPEVQDGGLMSFGPSLAESYRRTAALADQIVRGARPSDLPVEEPTRFTLVVNMKTAKALDVVLPPTIMVRADEVIE
ncbi:MAG TPA: ABC transporter substrate-binding protein [Stellaceae bacterium]|nr:ABC transporter substrate-binding protein [Stellaceae bacterium]